MEPAPHGTEKRYRWDKRHGIEPCANCAKASAQAAARRREDRNKLTANQPRAENKVRAGQPAKRDHCAPAMVREWSAEQRGRIRAILLQLMPVGEPRAVLASPEAKVIAMIDKASKEARIGG